MTGGEYFRGMVDELYLFDAALSQQQIQSLMRTNEPPDTPDSADASVTAGSAP
jgi:hypothetical protein